MKYAIPVNKLIKLRKIIEKYQKKGAAITFIIGDKVIERGSIFVNDAVHRTSYREPIDIECREVFVEGSYIINGWHFVGTVDFTENGNIIRLADSSFEGKVPAKYLHTPKICEHCGTIRNRKDTYLICSDNGEWKQVGSSCLLEYTRGLDADKCASIMSCLEKVVELTNYDYDFDTFKGDGFNSTGLGIGNSDLVRSFALGLVKAHGYKKMENGIGTASELADLFFRRLPAALEEELFGDVTPATDEEVSKVTEFAKTYFNSDNDYMRNASLAWCKGSVEYRDFGLIASFAKVYLRDLQSKQERADRVNEFVGTVGDKISFDVASARVLFYKDNRHISFYAASSAVYEIVDTEGHVYKWSATCSTKIYPGDKITAIIKAHDTYRDTKQTVIARGKVSHEEE